MRRVFIRTYLPSASDYRKPALIVAVLASLIGVAASHAQPTTLRGRPDARPSGPASKLEESLRGRPASEQVRVVVRLRDASGSVLAELTARGLTIERSSADFGMAEGTAAVGDLDDMAALPAVITIRELQGGLVRAGSVTSAGDAAAGLDLVRAAGLDGSGVTVGVISDGLGDLGASQASGDLPDVGIPLDARCRVGAGNEGTAVLEIVHDVAPGAKLLFASGVESPLHFVEALGCLIDAGADVVVDDIGFFTEPFFEDGVVAKAVRQAVVAGVSVHTAAGNSTQLHYEADFRTSPDDFHDFLADGTVDNMNGIAVDAGGRVACALQWDERFGQAGDDYDLELRDAGTLEILAESRNVQNGSQDPLEVVTFVNDRAAARTLGIAIQRIAGEARRLKMFCYGRGLSALQYRESGATVVGHPAVEGVVAVGAVDVADPGHDTVRPYSARGPARIRFPAAQQRPKPDVVAVDGIATSVPGYGAFVGTSAAAPHTAGLAALLLQRNPAASGGEVFDAITIGAIDLGPPGFDMTTGYGLLDGPGALDALDAPECIHDADCADDDACTQEHCEAGTCVRTPPCDDGDPCNGHETCDAGTCRPGSPLPDGTSCSDRDVCDGDEHCRGGECRGGQTLACRDADPCTVDACDPLAGCRFPPAEDFDNVGCRFVEPLSCEDGALRRFAARCFARAARRLERAARASRPALQRRRLLGLAAALERGRQRLQQKVERARLPRDCADAVATRFEEPATLARVLAETR
jgi:subtilisin family serine protease